MAQPARQISRTKAEEMLRDITALYLDADRAFEGRRAYFTENMAFYRGLHWGHARYDGAWAIDTDDDEAQEVLNYIRPTVRSAVAARLKADLNPESVPMHDDQRSMTRAMSSFQLMRSFLYGQVFSHEERYRAVLAAEIHGGSWFKTTWDPNVGDFYQSDRVDPETGEAELDEAGDPVSDIEREGDARVCFVDAFDFLPDPTARKEEDIRYGFHRKLVPRGQMEDWFPKDAFGKSTKGRFGRAANEGGQFERDSIEDNAKGGLLGNMDSLEMQNQQVELVEYWERPTHKYPAGRLIVYAGEGRGEEGGVILSVGPMPYRWPWDQVQGENVLPSALYGEGIVRDAISPQKTINLNASKRREWMDKILSPPLLTPKGSGIDADNFSDLAGEIIEHNPGTPPQWMKVPDIPQSMFSLETQLVGAIQDTSTYSGINRGEVTKGLDSGRALAYQNELESGVRAPDQVLWKRCVVSVLRKCLYLYRDFADDGRILNILGPNNRWMVRSFKADDYDFETAIIVDPFSQRPSSRALRYSERIEGLANGLYNDTPEAKMARTGLELDTGDSSTIDPQLVHRKRNMAEHDALLGGDFEQIEVSPFDDHELHLDADELFAISPEFLELPEDVQRWYIDEHIAVHQEYLSAQFADYQAQQQQANGQTPESQTGSQPAEPGQESPPGGGLPGAPGSAEMSADAGGMTSGQSVEDHNM